MPQIKHLLSQTDCQVKINKQARWRSTSWPGEGQPAWQLKVNQLATWKSTSWPGEGQPAGQVKVNQLARWRSSSRIVGPWPYYRDSVSFLSQRQWPKMTAHLGSLNSPMRATPASHSLIQVVPSIRCSQYDHSFVLCETETDIGPTELLPFLFSILNHLGHISVWS